MATSAFIAQQRTAFIGRRQELARLLAEIDRGSRLLTLTGPSGMGKTRLAQQVLAELDGAAPQAIACSVIGRRSAPDVQVAIAEVLGIPPQVAADLGRILAERGPRLLLVDNLDDAEGDTAEMIGGLLDQAGELQIVATSIVPLGLEGEVLFELGPLDQADAIALYLERAHVASAGRTFSVAEQMGISELVGRLDRVPLAIELAAARVRVLPPLAMLQRMERRFELLESGRPDRHGSLLRALTVTWDHLSPAEQQILRRASLFEGGFTLEAMSIFGDDENSIINHVDSLRAKALIQSDDEPEPRFSLYASVQSFARMQLEAGGAEEEATAKRHADFFLREGERHVAGLRGPAPSTSVRWLKAERENLTSILRRRAAVVPRDAARAGLALASLLALEGPPSTEVRLLDETLQAARAADEPELVVEALRFRACAIRQFGRSDEAMAGFAQALQLAREAGTRYLESQVLVDAGVTRIRRGELNLAVDDLAAAIGIARKTSDPSTEAHALTYLGVVERLRYSLERALGSYQRALALLRGRGHLRREAMLLCNMAVAWSCQGRFAEARQALDEMLAIARRLESRLLEGGALVNRGGVELAAGALEAAEHVSREALAIGRDLGHRVFEALSTGNLGIVALERGQLTDAEALLVEAIRRARESSEPRIELALLPFLAIVYARLDRIAEAERRLTEARELQGQAGDKSGLAVTDLAEGFVDLARARRVVRGPGRREAALLEERARERLLGAESLAGQTTDCLHIGLRLLSRELGDRTDRAGGAGLGSCALVIGPQASWFETIDGQRIDLRRRGSLRRMLDALVELRLTRPGECLAAPQLFSAGWEAGEAVTKADVARVHTGIWNLRGLGLSSAIVRQSEGYLLDPNVPVIRAKSP